MRRSRLCRAAIGLLLVACTESPTGSRQPSASATQTVDNLVITPVNRAFTVAQGGPSPATSKVTITSSGAALVGLAVGSITYGVSQPTGWLTSATLSGTTTPATLTMGVTPGTLPVGSYTATVPVTGSGAGNNPQVAKVTLNVVSGPWLLVTPNLRNFSGTVGGVAPAAKTISVTNAGTVGSTLTGLSVSGISYGLGEPTGWLTTATLNTTTAPATLTLRPTVGALPAGVYNATLSISSPVAIKSPATVNVKFTVATPTTPLIAVTPISRGFSATFGGAAPAAKTFSISNTGIGTLSGLGVGSITYGVGEPTGWLTTATLNTTTAPATLTVQPTIGALPAGSYTAKVPITSGVAGNSPINVTVTFTVSCPAAQPIAVGDTVAAALATTDCVLPGEGYVDEYLLDLSSPTDVVIDIPTATFIFPTIRLYNPTTGALIAGGLSLVSSARFTRALGAGSYVVRVAATPPAFGVIHSGTYQISVATSPVPIPYDGLWKGTAADGSAVSFTIQFNAVVSAGINFGQWPVGITTCPLAMNRFGLSVPLTGGNTFAFTLHDGNGTATSDLAGTISSVSSATGTFGTVLLTNHACGAFLLTGSIPGSTWTAARQ